MRLHAWVGVLIAAVVLGCGDDDPGRPDSEVPDGFVLIPAGTFEMGSPDSEAGRSSDETQHWVRLSKAFLLGETEVTQAQWEAVMGTDPSYFKGDNRPVEQVNWYDVVDYCNALSDKEGLTRAYTVSGGTVTWNRSANGYRLPTESEWEYACRAGTTTRYWSGEDEGDLARVAWYEQNSGDQTHDVKGKAANAWGLYDVHGNVFEWCWDQYGTYPLGSYDNPALDPSGVTSGSNRVLRGDSWSTVFDASNLRSALRSGSIPSDSYNDIGFRVARTVDPWTQAISVGVTPATATVQVGASQQFTAAVTGTANTAVTWLVEGGAANGTISSSGLYTAPATVPSPATVTVRATSQADNTKSATVTVTVVTAPVPAVYVRIEPGTFLMGSPETEEGRFNNETQHWVRITRAFLLGETEVTQAQWRSVMGTDPSYFSGNNRPVETVSWFDAVAYCNALSDREGLTRAYTINGTTVTWDQNASGYRLPTESEWEYACRAGTTTRYWSGNTESGVARVGWYGDNSGAETHDVKGKPANAWGLYDVHGNVFEWCWDWDGTYPAGTQSNPAVDPAGAASGMYRVVRGGSCYHFAPDLRSAARGVNNPTSSDDYFGFRVARTVDP